MERIHPLSRRLIHAIASNKRKPRNRGFFFAELLGTIFVEFGKKVLGKVVVTVNGKGNGFNLH
jgi:hypothetical protein